MSCRVVIEVPEHRRRYGGLHHVRIDLGLPGGELVIKNDPSLHGSIPEEEQRRPNISKSTRRTNTSSLRFVMPSDRRAGSWKTTRGASAETSHETHRAVVAECD